MVTDKALWLADFLYREKKATREQIEKAWEKSNISYGKRLGRRTFQETRNKVKRLFDINIDYNAKTHEYYFEDPEIFQENSIRNWLLKTLSVSNLLQRYRTMQERILLEEPAYGYFYLPDILEAMEISAKIELSYHPFNDNKYTTLFSPYCLKVFKQRWYVLGFSSRHQQIRTFSFDRIEDIALTEEAFSIPKDFNQHSYFNNCYGITYSPHLELEIIVFKVNSRQIPYFRTRPIHHSQTEIKEGIFQIKAYLSYELIQELLSYGSNIEVFSPTSVRIKIKEEAMKMIEMYQTKLP